MSRNDCFLGCIETLILTLINPNIFPNRDVHFTHRPIPSIEKNKTEIFTYKTILVLSMCCCFAAVVIKIFVKKTSLGLTLREISTFCQITYAPPRISYIFRFVEISQRKLSKFLLKYFGGAYLLNREIF